MEPLGMDRGWLPSLDYGTKAYPEKVARRLRMVNGTTWCVAIFISFYAVAQALDPTPGVWKPLLVNVLGVVAFASIPLLHRFGPLAAPIAFVVTAYLAIFTLILLAGTASGMQMQLLGVAAGALLFFDAFRARFAIVFGVTAIALIIGTEIAVPRNTGLQSEHAMLMNFVGTAIGTCAILLAVVWHAIREVARAEAKVEHEFARSEQLLLNILPASVAERLKDRSADVIADRYDGASVMFVDLAGFTSLAGSVAPVDLVRFLNAVFSQLDQLVQQHGLEKIKTSGDAYMVVSGVPEPRTDHAEALADFAIAAREQLTGLVDPTGRAVPARIGIASGAVVAGVVGTRKFFYDVWGDAVNTASRMESTGQAGRIQVAPGMYELLKNAFELEERGTIDVRGKGPMRTWFLVSRRAA
jgi:adenylate cyclase